MEALGLSRLAVIVLDMHTDVKGYSLFTLPQVRSGFFSFSPFQFFQIFPVSLSSSQIDKLRFLLLVNVGCCHLNRFMEHELPIELLPEPYKICMLKSEG